MYSQWRTKGERNTYQKIGDCVHRIGRGVGNEIGNLWRGGGHGKHQWRSSFGKISHMKSGFNIDTSPTSECIAKEETNFGICKASNI